MRKRLRVKHLCIFRLSSPLAAPPLLLKPCSLGSGRSDAAEELHECLGGRGSCSVAGCLRMTRRSFRDGITISPGTGLK